MNATNIEAYAPERANFYGAASQAQKAEMAMQMFFETTEQYAELCTEATNRERVDCHCKPLSALSPPGLRTRHAEPDLKPCG